VVLEEPQHDHGALLGGEREQRPAQGEALHGGLGLVVTGRLAHELAGQNLGDLRPPPERDLGVIHDLPGVRLGVLRFLEAQPGPMGTRERLLHEVLGEMLISGQEVRRAQQCVCPGTDELRIVGLSGVHEVSDRGVVGDVSVPMRLKYRGGRHASPLRPNDRPSNPVGPPPFDASPCGHRPTHTKT
jgi:hypothetical protein